MSISKEMTIKACSVGVSSYVFFKELRGFSLKNSAGLALSASVLALLLEKIRPKPKETNNWFECKEIGFYKDKSNQLDFLLKIIKIQIIAGIANGFYSIFYGFPQKDLISLISENKLK